MASIINCTPHPIVFKGDDGDFTVAPCGKLVSARAEEEPVRVEGEKAFVRTTFKSTPEGRAELDELEATHPGDILVGSIISAQAYPGRVFGMVAAPGFERVPPAEKRMDPTRFITFE